MNIEKWIHNRTVTKGFLFYKKHTFDVSIIFFNIFYFIFQYFDSV